MVKCRSLMATFSQQEKLQFVTKMIKECVPDALMTACLNQFIECNPNIINARKKNRTEYILHNGDN